MAKKPIIDWHRLFGIAVEEDFIDYIVLKIERERDLSVKQQYLDLLIIYTETYESLTEFLANPPKPLPDGLDNLSQHNLITYKSLQESLTPWTLQELVRHYVNYRKEETDKLRAKKKQEAKARKKGKWFQFGQPDPETSEADKVPKLLPEELFRLYAVCTRYPEKILDNNKDATMIQAGVYEIEGFWVTVRIIVLSQIPPAEHNALWNIFSNVAENIAFGAKHFEQKRRGMSSILDQLFKRYNQEGVHMAYTLKQFHQDYMMDVGPELLDGNEKLQFGFFKSIRNRWSLDAMLSAILDDEGKRQSVVQKFLLRLSPRERLEGLSPDEIKSYLEEIENK